MLLLEENWVLSKRKLATQCVEHCFNRSRGDRREPIYHKSLKFSLYDL